MFRRPLALVLGVSLWLCAEGARGQSALAPEAGLLLLRNGQVLTGEVTRAGDIYVVTQGTGVELRPLATDVEAFCATLEEAYEFKERRLSGRDIKGHLDLAEWCLRHNLHAKCAQQLVAAMRIDPTDQRLASLENRLKLAAEGVPTARAEGPSPRAVSAEELDQKLSDLPKASVEKFASSVQPILLNRCGANQCHGPNSKSEFQLLKPPPGQSANRRFTQRNLFAALRYLDASNPEASPLVTMPQQRHGGALTPVFDKHTQSQLAELIAWSKLATAGPAKSQPRTIAAPQGILSQPAAAERATNVAPAQTASGETTTVMRPAFDGQQSPAAAAGDRFVPRDPYDPEIFNRRFAAGGEAPRPGAGSAPKAPGPPH